MTETVLATVSAVLLDDGTPFHAHVIGLPFFRVPYHQAQNEGFLLAHPQQDETQ